MRFDHLTVEDGLSHNHVQAILKDSRGFIWFGTADGANRYDGSEFVVYRHDPKDPGSLPSATVAGVLRGQPEALLGGHVLGRCRVVAQRPPQDAGLSLYDREHDRFKTFRRIDRTAGANAVREFVEDRDGSLWLATGDGLARFDPETEDVPALSADRGAEAPGSIRP